MRQRLIWCVGLPLAVIVLLALGGEPTRGALRYERGAVFDGELWRLLTGHLVHGTTQHLLLNGAGLVLLGVLFARDFSRAEWLLIGAASVLAIDLGFVLLAPHLDWYVGFSGVLHGVLAAAAVAWWRTESKLSAAALTLVVAGKLAWEQSHGALPLSGDLPVVVDAHLYGALGGAAAALVLLSRSQGWLFRPRSL